MSNGNYATPSVSMPKHIYDRLRRRLPKYGDRSKVISELIRMFLDGQVMVVIPSKTIVVPERRV